MGKHSGRFLGRQPRSEQWQELTQRRRPRVPSLGEPGFRQAGREGSSVRCRGGLLTPNRSRELAHSGKGGGRGGPGQLGPLGAPGSGTGSLLEGSFLRQEPRREAQPLASVWVERRIWGISWASLPPGLRKPLGRKPGTGSLGPCLPLPPTQLCHFLLPPPAAPLPSPLGPHGDTVGHRGTQHPGSHFSG